MAQIYDSGFGGDMGGTYGGYDYAAEEERRRREAQRENTQQSPYQTPTQDDERRQPTYQNPRTAPQQEPERSQRPQDTRTFAQRQADGEARPAPPPPAAAPAPQSSMPVTAPQPVLYGTPSPGPGRFGLGGPVAPGDPRDALNQQGGVTGGGVDPIATIGGVGQRPDWMNATGGMNTMPRPNADGITTWTNVETPVANAPQYTPNNPPPANAVNGSTFRDANGVVWTKRLGIWAASDVSSRQQGYGGLTTGVTPSQSADPNLPTNYGQMTARGVDEFLRKYGTPSSDAEWAALSTASGMTVQQLKDSVAQVGSNPALRYQTPQEMAKNAEQAAWMRANNVSSMPDGYDYVPASQGGPGLRRRTYQEMRASGWQESPYFNEQNWNDAARAAEYDNNQWYRGLLDQWMVGGRPSANNATSNTGPTGNQTGGQPGSAVPVNVRPPVSYYEPSAGGGFNMGDYLQQQMAGAPGGVSAAGVNPVTAAANPGASDTLGIQAALREALKTPSAYDNEQVMALYNRLGQGIDDQFAQQEVALREEMARRGLADSSIQGGRLADLNVGRRSAQTELADRLATSRAQDYAAARNTLLGLGLQSQGQDNNYALQLANLQRLQQQDALAKQFGWYDRSFNYGQQAFENDLRQADFNRLTQSDQDQLMLRLLGLGG